MADQNGVAERNGITEQLADLANIKNQFGSLVDSYVEAFSGGLKAINNLFSDHLNGMHAFRRSISDLPPVTRDGGAGGGAGGGGAAGGGAGGTPKIHFETEGSALSELKEASEGLDASSETLYAALNKTFTGAAKSVHEITQESLLISRAQTEAFEDLKKKTIELQESVADRYKKLLISTQESATEQLAQKKAEQELRILDEVNKRREAALQELYEDALINGTEVSEEAIRGLEERFQNELSIAAIRADVTEQERAAIEERRAEAEAEKAEAKKKEKEKERDKKKQEAEEKKRRGKEGNKAAESIFSPTSGLSLKERWRELSNFMKNDDGSDKTAGQKVGALAAALGNALNNLVKNLENKMDAIGKYQAAIDTRLQGSTLNSTYGAQNSYWGALQKDIMRIGGFSPYFTQEDFSNNIKTLVDKGIAFDLKQRAFLMTIQDKIATTFEVADGTLLRLIRIQQADSTAGRLGMEAALNSFLNNMYENTEYLKDVASSVRGSLQEMSALMTSTGATEVEYQVQKWLGSLYSVGMSQEGVNAIAQAFGSLAAGDVDALSSGAGNLLVMAAQNSGISLTDMMSNGITASNTNQLFGALTNYLIQTAENTQENQVVMQQMAKIFGLKASDLKAAENLKTVEALEKTSGHNLGYDNMLSTLFSMADTMHKRTSIGEMLSNAWNNAQFSLASSVAKNPITYGLAKGATLLEDLTGGIDLPFLNVMGFGVDLNTSVAQLMRVGALTGGILGSIGDMVSGLGNMLGPGGKMLDTAGIKRSGASTLTIESRGSGLGNTGPGTDYSESGSITANGSGQDMADSTMAGAEKDKKDQLVEAKDEMEDNEVTALNTYVLSIYKILDQVINGSSQFHVKIASSSLGTDNLYGTGGGWGVVLGG